MHSIGRSAWGTRRSKSGDRGLPVSVVNLPARRMAGEISEAMLFDIGYADSMTPVLAIPERPLPNGASGSNLTLGTRV